MGQETLVRKDGWGVQAEQVRVESQGLPSA